MTITGLRKTGREGGDLCRRCQVYALCALLSALMVIPTSAWHTCMAAGMCNVPRWVVYISVDLVGGGSTVFFTVLTVLFVTLTAVEEIRQKMGRSKSRAVGH